MQVGNRVTCINDQFPEEIQATYFQLPVLDETYTVRAVYPGRAKLNSRPDDGAEVGILLEELHNPVDPRVRPVGLEMGFNSERFRIVEESVKVEIHHGEKEN